MGGGKAIVVAIDGLKVGVEAVVGTEDERLVDGHDENNGLREENSQGPVHGGGKSGPERSRVFVGNVISVASVFFEILFALFKNYGRIGFFEEGESDDSVSGADDSQDPENPSPPERLDNETAEERSESGPEKRPEKIPSKDTASRNQNREQTWQGQLKDAFWSKHRNNQLTL